MTGTTQQPARHHDYWYVPTKQPVPQSLQEAGRLSSEIDRHKATWKAEMDELTKLIEGQKPGEFDLSKEIATTDAFTCVCGASAPRGGSRRGDLCQNAGHGRELNQLLQAAPAKFRESASCARRFADTTSWEDIKQNYQDDSPISMRRRPRLLRCIKMMSRPTSTATS